MLVIFLIFSHIFCIALKTLTKKKKSGKRPDNQRLSLLYIVVLKYFPNVFPNCKSTHYWQLV